MYKNVKNELPTNTFECIVKMWNKFNDTWVTGIGIYDVPTEQWEIQGNGIVVNYPVHFWIKTPELDKAVSPIEISMVIQREIKELRNEITAIDLTSSLNNLKMTKHDNKQLMCIRAKMQVLNKVILNINTK